MSLRRRLRLAAERVPVVGPAMIGAARRLDAQVSGVKRTSATEAGARKSVPRKYRSAVKPVDVSDDWPEAPLVEHPHLPVRSAADPVAELPPHMDIDLFEALNEEYASKPLVPVPPGRDAASRSDRARDRLLKLHQSIDLQGKRVLEFGCGSGYEVWYLAHHFDADATGVDIVERRAWSVLSDERTHYVMTDLARDQVLPADSFDRIISFSVMEHVRHPYQALTELYRVLRPGGLAYISANLHRGPRASHMYRDVYFPWPHLLFQDDVFREFFQRRGREANGASWVNRLTWAEYDRAMARVGFRMESLDFSESPFDEEFYQRFEGILGRYPRWDLTRDFFHVVLRKPD